MKILSLCAVLVAVCGSVNSQQCCTPDQWQGWQYTITGTASGGVAMSTKESSMIYYDYTNARLAVFINVTQPNMDMKRMLILQLTDSSGMRMQYTLDIVNKGCQKMTLSEAMTKACVPDYAGEPMFFTYGAGPETLQAKGWDFKVMETEDDLEAMVAVTEDLCIPIAEDMVGTLTSKDNESMLSTSSFLNIMPGISRTDVFDIPMECQNARQVSPEEQRPHKLSKVLSM